MKKIYAALLTSVLLLPVVKGQVSTYVFSQLSGSYAAIGGGTVFGTTTSDDQVFVDPAVPLGALSGATGPGLSIGFTFTFNNIPFDRIGINNNGWIFFGQSTVNPSVNSNSSSGYIAISATSTASLTLQNRVAALSRDLQAQVGGDLRVQTIGTTPNQVCVIQWNNYRKFAATGDSYNFQIRLYETSNVVEVVYGAFLNNATTATAEVGLRGSSNADFNNRNIPTTGNWATSSSGLTNNTTGNLNGTGLVPANGQVYRWTPPSPCVGSPASNSVVSSLSVVCPNSGALLTLANSYTNTGILYQWFSSTVSAVGPFLPIANATLSSMFSGSLQTSTFFQASITCSFTSQSSTATSQGIQIAATTTNSVPYFESFEGITFNNQLPNCSWAVTSPSTICQTNTIASTNNRIPRTGNKFASFRFGTNVNGDLFYSNGIQLEPGITYSASVWYITDGLVGWQNLSMAIGTLQTSSSLTNVATLSGVPSGQFYQPLTNTFVVPSSGLYYMAIRCTANSVPQFLSFDDLSITIPCSLNSPNASIVSSSSLICRGDSVYLSAFGSGNVMWSTGSTSTLVSLAPMQSDVYTFSLTSNNTGCTSTVSTIVQVQDRPQVSIFAPMTSVCLGSSLTLYGFGASSYTWSSGSTAGSAVLTPNSASVYTVLGSWSMNSCVGTATQAITVKQLPSFLITNSREDGMCIGESATLSVMGNNLTQVGWNSNNITINSPTAIIAPMVTSVYTVSVTDVTGCSSSTVFTQLVSACTGVDELEKNAKLKLFPNPSSGKFSVKTTSPYGSVAVLDLSGKVIVEYENTSEVIEIDIINQANGIYVVRFTNGSEQTYSKIVKE